MKAYFAGGCFWCITPILKMAGASGVVCGYSGGDERDPKYEDVKAQRTGHRETVEVTYDEGKVSLSRLLDIFLANIDPYDADGQYIDRGHSYTAAFYYQDEEERRLAGEKISALEAEGGRAAHVAVEPFKFFCRAEEEHQDYYLKNPEEFEKELKESGRV